MNVYVCMIDGVLRKLKEWREERKKRDLLYQNISENEKKDTRIFFSSLFTKSRKDDQLGNFF